MGGRQKWSSEDQGICRSSDFFDSVLEFSRSFCLILTQEFAQRYLPHRVPSFLERRIACSLNSNLEAVALYPHLEKAMPSSSLITSTLDVPLAIFESISPLSLDGCFWHLQQLLVERHLVQNQELALMCARMFLEDSDNNEKYVSEQLSIVAEQMTRKIRTFAERQSENKRKQDDNQQQQ
ncbi:hypothetical protein Tco_1228310 [Tanacetum coccineum]